MKKRYIPFYVIVLLVVLYILNPSGFIQKVQFEYDIIIKKIDNGELSADYDFPKDDISQLNQFGESGIITPELYTVTWKIANYVYEQSKFKNEIKDIKVSLSAVKTYFFLFSYTLNFNSEFQLKEIDESSDLKWCLENFKSLNKELH